MTKCPRCGAECEAGSRFCEQCRFDLESGSEKTNDIAVGDKNVIAGDVASHKEAYSVSGNATFITNEDESKKMVQCAICGKNMPIAQSFECQECHHIVCEVCFNTELGKCRKCAKAVANAVEDSYRAAITEALADGKIDIADRRKLMALQKQLGIASTRAIQIEKDMKSSASSVDMRNTALFDKANAEKAFQLLYVKGDYKKASELMAPICERHPEDENALAIYLAALTKFNPVKAKLVVAKLQADVLCGALSLIDIDIKHKDFSSVEKRIESALGIWPDNAQLKCRKAVYAYELFKVTEDSAPLMEAMELVESIGETNDAVEKSWKFFAKRLIDSALGEDVGHLDRVQCDRDGLLWDIVSSNEDKSAALYRIIDVSAGPRAMFYPTYYMNTESIKDWSDEFKTNLIVLRHILPGSFKMGSEAGREYNNPPHVVTLTHSFYIGVFEVTQRQWELVMGERPSCFNNDEFYAKRPVEMVSYQMIRGKRAGLKWPDSKEVDSNSFVGMLRRKTDLMEIDLPTESQWEYACRAGTETDYYDGFDICADGGEMEERLHKIARYDLPGVNGDVDLSSGTGEVGSLEPNAWGLYDMLGNVMEFCLDSNFCIEPWREIDPEHGSNIRTDRRVRGGCWRSEDFDSVAVWCGWNAVEPDSVNGMTGLRLAVQLKSASDVQEWKDCKDEDLLSVPEGTVYRAGNDCDVDMASAYLYARCLQLGSGGIKADKEVAETIFKRLSKAKYPQAEREIAKGILSQRDKLTSSEDRRSAILLLHDAASLGDDESWELLQRLTKLSPGCVSAVVAILKRYAVKEDEFKNGVNWIIPDSGIDDEDFDEKFQREEIGRFVDSVKKILNCKEGQISEKVLTYFKHNESWNGNKGTILTDSGIYAINDDGSSCLDPKANFAMLWDEFAEFGDVSAEGRNWIKIRRLDGSVDFISVSRQFSWNDCNKALLMFKEIQACVNSWYKCDASVAEKWCRFPLEGLSQIDRTQLSVLDGLSGTNDPDIALRRAICLGAGYGCEAQGRLKVIEAYRTACMSGKEEPARRLVEFAALGKESFANAAENYCLDFRRAIKAGAISASWPVSEEIICVGVDVVKALLPGLMAEFAKRFPAGSSYAPRTPIAFLPFSKRDVKHGILIAAEGIYIVSDSLAKGQFGFWFNNYCGYLTLEELIATPILSVSSEYRSFKGDFVLTEKPEEMVFSFRRMGLGEGELRKFFEGLIELYKSYIGAMKTCGECKTVAKQDRECPSCHARCPIGAKFCPECGCNLASGDDVPPAVPPVAGGEVDSRE